MSTKPKRSLTKKPPSIADRIRPVADIESVSSYAIYGRAGSGKTTLASSFPKPMLLLDIRDKGTDSIADIKGIDVIEIECLEDIEDLYYDVLLDNDKGYRTLVFDTVTEMQKLVMKSVVDGKGKKKAGGNERLGDWGTMAKRDWGDVAGVMNNWIALFRDLDMEVVFLAQERTKGGDDDDDDNALAPEVGPAVMPSIANTLNAAVNVIGNTFIRMKKSVVMVKGKKRAKEEPVYCLRVGPNPIYTTKLRKPKSAEAPSYIEDATYEDIRSLVKGD